MVVLLVGLLASAACGGAADEERTSRPSPTAREVVYADSVRAWRTEYADPFAELARGNVQPWERCR
ncbi:MAG: hypothetical protein ACRDPP_14840 [Gaiellaceae bacterium]